MATSSRHVITHASNKHDHLSEVRGAALIDKNDDGMMCRCRKDVLKRVMVA